MGYKFHKCKLSNCTKNVPNRHPRELYFDSRGNGQLHHTIISPASPGERENKMEAYFPRFFFTKVTFNSMSRVTESCRCPRLGWYTQRKAVPRHALRFCLGAGAQDSPSTSAKT